MTNDTPPRACLTDFGFTTMALDTQNQMSSSLTLGGGTMAFMAPELLAPSKFGLKQSVPTREADVYAFGLVILQVFSLHHRYIFNFLMPRQVLTGEQPFHDLKAVELPYHVSLGVRPGKPPNAEAIGISDSLWELIQNCWDGDKTQRPQIQEVVVEIGEAAASWRTDMPAGGTEHWEDSVTEEEPDEMKYGEFLLFLIASFPLRLSAQQVYSGLIRTVMCRLQIRVPALRNSAVRIPSLPNPLTWKPTESIPSSLLST